MAPSPVSGDESSANTMYRAAVLFVTVIGFAVSALADAAIVYKGKITDTSAGNTYCGFAGDITITVTDGIVHGKPRHGPGFSAPLEGNHFHVLVYRPPRAAMLYDGNIEGDTITGTYRLTGAAQVHRGGPRHCRGDITATLLPSS